MKFFNLSEIGQGLMDIVNPSDYVIRQPRTKEGIDSRVVARADRNSYIAEQYEILRTNLYALSTDTPIKTIVLTSSQPEEGKTVTSCNLAVTLSLDTEKKVVLIDADLRKSAIHRMFGLERKPGFSDILSSPDVSIDDFIKKPAIGDLCIIPSGSTKTNPAEILFSSKLKSVIDQLRSKFDYIIFDTPPVLSVTDACILGSLCDAVLLVVKADVTQKTMIEESVHMLGEAQARPKACVLTNVYHLLEATYYFYRHKYYRYTAEDRDKRIPINHNFTS